jgi:hypothetical protein
VIRRLLMTTVACGAAVVMAAPLVQAPTAAAAAQPRNRAAVIVDTGQEVKRVCVRFDEETLSGAEILRRAEVDAVFASYGAKGDAVCALCGVGCPSDNCFCDRNRYWSYSRAEEGRTTFTKSSVGASSTRVGNGDVEGWRWGTGAAPQFASVEVVCGEVAAESSQPAPTTTTTTTAAGSGGSGGAVTAAPTTVRPAGSGSVAPTSTPVPASSDPADPLSPPQQAEPDNAPASPDAGGAAQSTPRPSAAPSPSPSGDEPSSSAPALLAVAAVAVGLTGWWAMLRRRRAT